MNLIAKRAFPGQVITPSAASNQSICWCFDDHEDLLISEFEGIHKVQRRVRSFGRHEIHYGPRPSFFGTTPIIQLFVWSIRRGNSGSNPWFTEALGSLAKSPRHHLTATAPQYDKKHVEFIQGVDFSYIYQWKPHENRRIPRNNLGFSGSKILI